MLLLSIIALLLPVVWLRFVPTDIAGCIGWWKADGLKWQDGNETVPATADNDPVGAWKDNSASGADVKVSFAAAALKLAIINGLPVIRFNGSDSGLIVSGTGWAQPLTLFIVYDVLGSPSVDQVLVDGATADSMEIRINDTGDTTKFDVYAGNFLTRALPTNAGTPTLNEVIWNGVSSSVYQNKVLVTSGNAGTASPNGIQFGQQSNHVRNLNCDIGEVVLYNTALGTSDRQSVENYLDRWFFTPPPPPTPGFGEFQATFEEGGSMLMPTTRSWGRW